MCLATKRESFKPEGRKDCFHLPAGERCEHCREQPMLTLTEPECLELMLAADMAELMCVVPIPARRKLELAFAQV